MRFRNCLDCGQPMLMKLIFRSLYSDPWRRKVHKGIVKVFIEEDELLESIGCQEGFKVAEIEATTTGTQTM
mgnify:CR=1 FL=1